MRQILCVFDRFGYFFVRNEYIHEKKQFGIYTQTYNITSDGQRAFANDAIRYEWPEFSPFETIGECTMVI